MKTFEVKWRAEGVALVKGDDADTAVSRFHRAIDGLSLEYGEADLVDDTDFDAFEILAATFVCD